MQRGGQRCDLDIIFTICEKKGIFGGFVLVDIVWSAFSWINVCVVQSAGVFVIFSISLRLDFTSSPPQTLELE